ncbi:MAG: alpha/beta hydrolase [Deltaproteobacteria bacterium]|nr:alpha/beta hydrolase [Deltaproteobacteria bacterium]
MFDTIVRRFLYYPTRLPRDAGPPSYARGAREVFFRAGDGNEIHALYWPAPEGRPTILFFHGNAQTVFEWALIHEELAPLECGLFLVDYPGYGKSTGEPSEASLYAAGQAALKHLTDGEKIDEARIVIFGKSLGGGVTAEVAKGRRVMGIVLESTFTSIPSVARLLLPMIPSDALLASERYESLKKLSEITVPVLVVHGDRDELIPVDEGKNSTTRRANRRSSTSCPARVITTFR